MLIALFITELILAAIIIFTTYMMSNKFKGIEISLGIYSSPRAYKTQSHVAFIEKVIKKYKECIDTIGEEANIESIIKSTLYKEYIGKFPFAAVKSIALKATRVMWGIIFLEGIVAFINNTTHEVPTILIITTSILLTIMIEMFKYIKSVEDQNDVVIMLVQDYLLNVYPMEVRKSLTNKEIVRLRTRVTELERELKTEDAIESAISEYREKEKVSNDELSMQDIVKLIGIFQ
ncbi:hypothetical protein [Cellulosilyticum sp. I15G10I2]|uniref:hypothetical protein n=1 Tax=Cellulosilyticum sp. I15G10I2 TaxID=1892843 RepID=UPI00085C7B77|nr:hypothetical protein [Cellulosilyticum sp. I15G10I2]